jgi:hypothetical protein
MTFTFVKIMALPSWEEIGLQYREDQLPTSGAPDQFWIRLLLPTDPAVKPRIAFPPNRWPNPILSDQDREWLKADAFQRLVELLEV